MQNYVVMAINSLLLKVGKARLHSGGDTGDGNGPGEYAETLDELQQFAGRGDAVAQYKLGLMYDCGYGVTQDAVQALRWYRLAAVNGISNEPSKATWTCETLQGVSPHVCDDLKRYRLAAAQGDARAQNTLGVMYFRGKCVPQDGVRAQILFDLAAASGDTIAAKNRDFASTQLTPHQLAHARKVARHCRQQTFKASD